MPRAITADSTMARTDDQARRRRNLRTALVLFSIAAVFFAGVIVNHLFGA